MQRVPGMSICTARPKAAKTPLCMTLVHACSCPMQAVHHSSCGPCCEKKPVSESGVLQLLLPLPKLPLPWTQPLCAARPQASELTLYFLKGRLVSLAQNSSLKLIIVGSVN